MNRFVAIAASFTSQDYPTDWAHLYLVKPEDACSVPDYPLEIEGKIAVVYRGGCSFYEKVALMKELGAAAVVVVNLNEPSNLFSMAHDSTGRESDLPAIMIQGNRLFDLKACYLNEMQTQGSAPLARIVYKETQLQPHHNEQTLSKSNESITPLSRIRGSLAEFVYFSLDGLKLQIRKEGKVHHLAVL
jgi:hypothetical protein